MDHALQNNSPAATDDGIAHNPETNTKKVGRPELRRRKLGLREPIANMPPNQQMRTSNTEFADAYGRERLAIRWCVSRSLPTRALDRLVMEFNVPKQQDYYMRGTV